MAGELQLQYVTGETIYAIRTRAIDGFWWDVVDGVYEAPLISAFEDYVIAMAEDGAGYYRGDDPDAGTEGAYIVRLQATAAPLTTDVPIGLGSLDFWDGLTAEAANKIADHTLRRDTANVEASADGDPLVVDSLYGSLMAKFKSSITLTLWSILKRDGSALGTKTVSIEADPDGITGVSD